MLRRTAARAFGGGEAAGSDVPPASHETFRDAAVERLFGDLHHRLAELVERAPDVEDADLDGLEELADGEGWDASPAPTGGAVRITRPRALSHGVEFTLVGSSYACRFVNSMTGFIRVDIRGVEQGEERPEPLRAEVLSVHPYWGTFRPILKPLRCRGPRATRTVRTAFCYSSAEELSAHYLDLVRGT